MLREHLGSRTSGRVFQSKSGTPFDTCNVLSEGLFPLCEKLSISCGGLHALRHGRVSHLQANSVPGDFTETQAGRSSLRTTSDYTHFSQSFMRETVERLAAELHSWTHCGNFGLTGSSFQLIVNGMGCGKLEYQF